MTTNSSNRPKPPVPCTPCRVTYQGVRYQIESNGTVQATRFEGGVTADCRVLDDPEPDHLAKLVRREAARQRRNRTNREKYQAMKDIGMVKTPYGWE